MRIKRYELTVVFTDDENEVTKNVSGHCSIASNGRDDPSLVNKRLLKEGVALQLSRITKEADRDLAFLKHGDDYRSYTMFKSNFYELLSNAEVETLASGDNSTD